MKTKLIALVIAAVSFSVHAMDVSQAQEAVAHAERNYSAALGSYNSEAHYSGSGVVGSYAESQLNKAAADRSQAYSDLNSANQAYRSANAPVASQLSSVNTAMSQLNMLGASQTAKPQPVASQLTSVSKDMETANIAGAINTGKTGNTTINVAASSLAPLTKVKTDKGIVTAGSLPKNTQVAVTFNSAFNKSVKGGNDHSTGRSYGEHGTGNGANNAANSNSAHGLGGGSNIGGGRSGGGFHY
ncbi:hypothetical protein N8W35_10035 [Enterobacter roggenkampii]|uniref:hypothetical protein n=1 Tax=Enterobacter roggenkampii TaxID=1812935 RepID=UPI0021C85A82|nr:hypothetical protein [Enterobacter roggenkampii]MCU3853444.1 hypothetical protein [Enterobacter roggenkampii]